MKPTVIILNGFPQSGKDTFCEFAEEKYRTVNYSTVETTKEAARVLGWDGEKTQHNRDMLSALKDFHTEWFDGPFLEMVDLIEGYCEYNDDLLKDDQYSSLFDFVFIHSREPEEIKRVVEFCKLRDVECYTVFIMREDVDGIPHANHADANVKNMIYNVYIGNNGTLEVFKDNVLTLLDSMMSGSLKNWTDYKEE